MDINNRKVRIKKGYSQYKVEEEEFETSNLAKVEFGNFKQEFYETSTKSFLYVLDSNYEF